MLCGWFCIHTIEAVEDGRWINPRKMIFSNTYSDWDISLSPDGKRLYFSSKRPLPGMKSQTITAKIWFVEKNSRGKWREPRRPGIPENLFPHEVHPSIARNQNIYHFPIKKTRRIRKE